MGTAATLALPLDVPRPIKILSDFDGVWTNQADEAAALVRFCIESLGTAAGVSVAEAERELAPLREAMAAAPHGHGWAPGGRISAYVDEDPLVESSALCRAIDHGDDPVALRYRAAVLDSGCASLDAFSQRVFADATAAFRTSHLPCLLPDAPALLAGLEAAGAEVVIISNSGSDKITAWFDGVGIDAGEGEGHRLKVRGAAAKWQLGPTDAAIEVAGRTVFVDRPRYREAIEAEQPDLIIGDVFSLDLAMPHMLRTHGLRGAPRQLVLRHHPHTPSWVLDTAGGGAIDHIVGGLADLPQILAGWR